MSRLQQRLLYSTLVLSVLLMAGKGGVAATANRSPLERSAQQMASIITTKTDKPNLNYWVGRALIQQHQVQLGAYYLSQVPASDPAYSASQALLRSTQLQSDKGSVQLKSVTENIDEKLASVSTAYQANGWIPLLKTQARMRQQLGPIRVMEKEKNVLIVLPYYQSKTPISTMGAQALMAIQPILKDKATVVRVLLFNRPFEVLELRYSVDRQSRSFRPTGWLINERLIQIEALSKAESRELGRFASAGF